MTPSEILDRWLFTLAIDALRYLVPTVLAFAVFWVWGRERFRPRRTGRRAPAPDTIRHDLAWSASTIVVFSIVGVATFWCGRVGIVQRYPDVATHGWAWFVASIVLLVILQDAYFYWTHRAMHHPRLYRAFHAVHHVSREPSPFTAYAFAIPEALVHAVFVPLVWIFVPLHELAVFAFLVFMILRNVLGHLSIELAPSGFTRHPFWRWHTTTTHHALHHAHAGFDFGLYTTFWDRLCGTLHPRYDETFERIAAGPASRDQSQPVDQRSALAISRAPAVVVSQNRTG